MPNEELMQHLAEIVIESTDKEYLEVEDPFDLYANRLKKRIYGDVNELSSRCSKGYQNLLNQIQSE